MRYVLASIGIAAMGGIVLGALPARAQVSITECGQTVPERETGILSTDLVCPGGVGTFGVALENRATLDLAGHTLAEGTTGVRCLGRRCAVTSTADGGAIRDMETAGIAVVDEHGKLNVSNVTLADDLYALLTNFEFGKITGSDLTITGSGIGMQASKIQLDGLDASANFKVSQARKTSLSNSTITASEDTALSGTKVSLVSSSVTGSGSGSDLLVDRKPKLVDSTCGTSHKLSNPVETWGVCTND
jgi:hypothetical protein